MILSNLWVAKNQHKMSINESRVIFQTRTINRRLSFLTITIEDMETIELKKNRMNKAIGIINRNTSVLNEIITMYYNFIKNLCAMFYIKNVYTKFFNVNVMNVYSNNKLHRFNKDLIFCMNDNQISINGWSVPYENIITFTSMEGMVYIKLFGTLENENYVFSDNCMELLISFKSIKMVRKIMLLLRQNMFYHIKYNKINDIVIEYFQKIEESETDNIPIVKPISKQQNEEQKND